MLTPLSKDSNATVSSERDSRNLPTAAFIARYNRELARWTTVCRSARSSARHFILEKILPSLLLCEFYSSFMREYTMFPFFDHFYRR